MNKDKKTYSLIVPVYNRPDEVEELLDSLTKQMHTDFEVVIVEDGSTNGAHEVVKRFQDQLTISYYYKENEGPGPTRNYGADKAHGDYFIFFDSDCIVPKQYLSKVHETLSVKKLDAFGGPDAAHPSFTPVQKAINYSMTSFFTTGGIRGGKEQMEKFHPRSFNMGISRQVYETTQGFSKMRFGEDIDLSLRIMEAGFSTGLIREAFVYHKRRTDFTKFYRQIFNSGIARINLFKRHPQSLKVVHVFPTVFVLGTLFLLIMGLAYWFFVLPIVLYASLVLVDASIKNQSVVIGGLSVWAAFTQLFAYGFGFLKAVYKRIVRNESEFRAFEHNFYK